MQLATLLVAAALFAIAAPSVAAKAYTDRLVGGAPLFDSFGTFVQFYIFGEVAAPLTPAPVLELYTIFKQEKVILAERPHAAVATDRNLKLKQRGSGLTTTQTASQSLSETVNVGLTPTLQVPRFARLYWHVRKAPFGALSATGPQYWEANQNSQFTLTNLRFRSAGRYDVYFNTTLLTGEKVSFNRTITIQRQPTQIVHKTTVAGYNGSALFPAPTGQMQDFVGADVATSTVSVSLVFEASPTGSTIRGTLRKFTTSTGRVQFTDVICSIPGVYTFRLAALLSDGNTLTTASQAVTVERALPERIIMHTQVSGIARFHFYVQPLFSIVDAAGPSMDPRMNMTLAIVHNAPSLVYEGFDTFATLLGTTTVPPVNYRYVFTDVTVDLPGRYTIRASLSLPTGAIVAHDFAVIIGNPPTYEVPNAITVNTLGTVVLFGEKPQVSPVFIKLATDANCVFSSSDEIPWVGSSTALVHNITIVPFNQQPSYVCMRIPSQTSYAALLQNYLQQFAEPIPQIFTFSVLGVADCQPLTATQAFQYRVTGWREAEPLRRYGCALQPPVAGTVPPCSCPEVLVCKEYTHPRFTPPGLDIGQCVCCKPWVFAVSSIISGAFFIWILFVIVTWV